MDNASICIFIRKFAEDKMHTGKPETNFPLTRLHPP